MTLDPLTIIICTIAYRRAREKGLSEHDSRTVADLLRNCPVADSFSAFMNQIDNLIEDVSGWEK